MSNSEFESLVVGYLEGTASQVQIVRLRDAIKSSPAMQQRFHSRLRLHQAQLSVLRRREDSSFMTAMLWLQGFAQRSGRSFAHLCLLALVFVELRVTIPAVQRFTFLRRSCGYRRALRRRAGNAADCVRR